MKKFALVAAVVASGFIGAASAADMPTKAPIVKAPVAAPYNWTGFYVGANIGYGWGTSDPGPISFYAPATVFVGSIPGISGNLHGVIGGGQIGYNFQFNNFVLGVEGDFSGTGINGSVTDPVNNYTAKTEIQWLATIRGRAGVVFDRTLVYATGGVAIAGVKTTLNDVYPVGIVTTTSMPTYVGWTIGGGAEMALWSNWSAKAEYLYVDLGSKQNDFYEPSPPGWPRISTNIHVTTSIVRVGLNYKFN
jgi:outer membrane immunogenic protein